MKSSAGDVVVPDMTANDDDLKKKIAIRMKNQIEVDRLRREYVLYLTAKNPRNILTVPIIESRKMTPS